VVSVTDSHGRIPAFLDGVGWEADTVQGKVYKSHKIVDIS
jgi:hypothetical protein